MTLFFPQQVDTFNHQSYDRQMCSTFDLLNCEKNAWFMSRLLIPESFSLSWRVRVRSKMCKYYIEPAARERRVVCLLSKAIIRTTTRTSDVLISWISIFLPRFEPFELVCLLLPVDEELPHTHNCVCFALAMIWFRSKWKITQRAHRKHIKNKEGEEKKESRRHE